MMSSSTSATGSLITAKAALVSVSPNHTSMFMMKTMPLPSSSLILPPPMFPTTRPRSRSTIRCEVAVEESTSSTEGGESKIGARIRVKAPLKVYHVPKVPEFDLSGMEGQIKQYVALWKGKRISANLPYKVEFVADIQGRGPVKFFAHLKDDEFDYL